MEFRTLGELEVWDGGKRLDFHGEVQRAVLMLLLLHANDVVRLEDIVDEIWGHPAPPTAAKMVQNAVSKLRKSGFADVLATRQRGYVLHTEPGELDSARFEWLLDEARTALAAGTPEVAERLLEHADELWRGPPLAELATEGFAQLEISRLEELRLDATELAIETGLALGRHRELVPTLEVLVERHPLRETLRAKLMLSLYRSGRQAEALAAYQSARTYLRDEVGLEPSPALQRLEQAILLQDSALELDLRNVPTTATATHALRKTLTVLHAELTREGRMLDPEALRTVSASVEDAVTGALAAHGGTLSMSAGVAIVGVFGLPVLAEDDTLRAARSALDARSALATLGESLEAEWGVHFAVRIGVASGTALVEPDGSATGDAFDVAARLARAAAAGEVLLARSLRRTLRDGVSVEPAGEVELGGTTEPVWRLIDVAQDATTMPRSLDVPLVGRNWELAQLRHALERATQGNTSYLVTILGQAGIGKSRLAREFADTVADSAIVLVGRCPSYGAGVTFWPLTEIVRQAAGGTTREAIAAVVADDPDAEEIAATLAGAVGADEPTGSADDLFLAVRSLFASLARARPLVVIFDDLHWAEPTLLDLLEHLVDATRDAPVLLLCLARSELLDTRPSWGGGKVNASAILLEPLSQSDRELLIAHAGGRALEGSVAARIAEAAEGNPLFLEQMVAMALEERTTAGDVTVPPTIQALLAARLDRLDPFERTVLERASVAGKEFWRSEVIALSPDDEHGAVQSGLETLMRRELLGPAAAPRRGDAAFRFRHGLIRDAAYDALPKADRAILHEELARFLERTPEHPARGHEEVIGFHLEQAHRYRVELGQTGAETRGLAEEAGAIFAAAGRRAYARDDIPAAVALLERAAELYGAGTPERLELLPDLGEAVRESGDYPAAEAVLAEAISSAASTGDRALEEYARLIRLRMRVQTDVGLGADEVISGARRALDAFASLGDGRSLAKAWELLAWGRWLQCQAAATEEALAHSLEHARLAGDERTAAQSVHLLLGATVFGPLPVTDGIARCEAILADGTWQKRVTASALRALAALKAMAGEFDEARALLRRFSSIVDDLGLRVTAASAAETYAAVELLAGDAEAAEHQLRSGYEQLGEMGESSTSANLAALLAQALHMQGRDLEAVAVSDVTPADDDVSARVHLAVARASALGAVGRLEEAEQLARDAVERAKETDFLVMWGDALRELADILARTGRASAARELLEEALVLYRHKQHIVAARGAEDQLARLVERM